MSFHQPITTGAEQHKAHSSRPSAVYTIGSVLAPRNDRVRVHHQLHRHAFQGTEGKVLVELHCAGNFVECRVSDDGKSPRQIRRGRGLAIIHELAKHLDGRLEQSFGIEGSSSLLIFPS
jgi:hypothetical protein